MVEVFRRRVITLLVDRQLLNEDFARNLLSWKHSGFSQDAWASNERQRVTSHRQQCSDSRRARAGESGRVHRTTTHIAQENPLRAIQGEGSVPHEILAVLQAEPPPVRCLRLLGRIDATHSTKGTPAHPALRALCLPHKGTVERNAVVSGSFLGYACGTTLMSRSARPRGGEPPTNAA